MDYYEILGVGRDATQEQVLHAYRRLALEYHPDRNPNGAEHFKKITEAFEVLHNFDKRARYNAKIPQKRGKKKKGPLKAEDFFNDPNLGNCRVGRAPTYDIWGRKLTPEERRKWEEDAARDIAEFTPPDKFRWPTAKPRPRQLNHKEKDRDGFVDIYAKQYLRDEDQPHLR
jgi:curved DNA-binding protein CbpA